MTKTVAVIDVGSNSIKLLVAEGSAAGLHTLFTETIETRISRGISKALPELSVEAIEAGCSTIHKLLTMAQHYKPKTVAIVATSAVRDAVNGQAFIEQVFVRSGLQIRLLSGQEEATLICKGLSCDPAIAGIPSFIQTDIGGGSMELIRFENGAIRQAISLQLGAVRLTEQFVTDRDAAIDSETESSIRQHVEDVLLKSGFDFHPKDIPLIATGGAYTVSRAVLAAARNENIEISSPELSRTELSQLKGELAALPLHERLTRPHLPAARADIIVSALITIETLLELSQRQKLTHSFYNLRYGVATELLSTIQ